MIEKNFFSLLVYHFNLFFRILSIDTTFPGRLILIQYFPLILSWKIPPLAIRFKYLNFAHDFFSMQRTYPLLLLISALLIFSPAIMAQEEVELDPVTITASLYPVPASGTGRNIITIQGDHFRKFPIHSLDDLLRYIPGIEIQARGPQGSQSDIVLRGATFQQSLVVLDGIRLNDPNTGHFSSYIPISPAEIDRIEVLKGASSGIYGSEAVGGVINIITKSFSAKKNQLKKNISMGVTGGEYGLFNVNAGGFVQQNNTAVAAGILSNNSNGQPQRGTRGGFHNSTGSLSLKQFFNDAWSLSLRSAYDERKFDAQNFYTSFLSDTANEKVATQWNQARISYQKVRHTIAFDAGYKTVKDIYQYNPSSTANNNRSALMQFQLTDHLRVSEHTTISTGAQYIHKKIRSNDRGNHELDQAAGIAIVNQKWGDFTASPSVRLDWTSIRGWELVPQLNLSYHTSHMQLRASAGKTIRDADFTELYNNYNKALVTGGSIGNPGLFAERSLNYEIGADYFMFPAFKISATLFQRRQEQLIDWVTTAYSDMPRKDNLSPTGTYALAKNLAKVNTSGLELDMQLRKEISSQQDVFMSLGLTWLDTDIKEAKPSFYLSSHAKFLTNFNVMYTAGRVTFTANGIYKHRQPQTASAIHAKLNSDYFVLNGKLNVSLGKRLSVFTQVDNILDTDYSDLLGSQMPGRWWMGGVVYEFK